MTNFTKIKAIAFLLSMLLISAGALNAQIGKPLSDSALLAKKNELFIPPFKQMPERFPKYPLKTRRMIYTDSDIILARQNLIKYPEARKVRDTIIKSAGKWLEWSDADLRDLLTDARVPRAFDLNPKGSPVHGDAVFKKGGFYPWIVDPRHPFQVKSPIDGEIFPTNDYASYYKSGFKDKKGWDTKYVDDGWGWIAPDGERYWFVAYANHWLWKDHIEPGVADLARAYLLTGDKRYAHKAAVMLHRLAEVYPSMDHANQSRYGLMERAKGHVYNGKIVNLIWETTLIQNAAEAYDAVWDSIDDDTELQKFYGKNGQSIRSFIEANLLEDALDAYMERKIQGNYGMHQSALLYILLARQNMDTDKYLHMIVEDPGESRVQTGIRYALYNMIFRDGQALESPEYNMLTVDRMATLSESLYKGGLDLFKEPRLRMLINGPVNMVAAGRFTPDIGDNGNALGKLVGLDPNVYQIGYKMYKDPRYLTWLATIGKTGGSTFSTFESLFREALPETSPLPDRRSVPVQKSRLFAGYGLGILNNKEDNVAVSFNYGFKGTHFHWDFLNFELFANGQKMMPDLGYPDAMNEYVKEIYTWSTNTISHNTVVVDSRRQKNNLPGVLHDFASGNFAKSMDASSPAYPNTTQYRRNLILVDADDKQSYVVDFFRVSGGTQHDYSLHGPPGKVDAPDGKWSSKKPGTLAGQEVEIGQIYDDPGMGAKNYSGSYWNYGGSGYQYLYNVQQLESGKSILQYQHLNDENARVKIHVLPYQAQEVFQADAYDKPRAKSFLLKYIIARRKSVGTEPLKSTFVGIMEPYGSTPYISSYRFLALKTGKGVALEVTRANATDVVISDTANSAKQIPLYQIETDATSAVVSFDKQGSLSRVFFTNGTYLRCKGKSFSARSFEGTVTGIDIPKGEINVSFRGNGMLKPESIDGKAAHFSSSVRTTVHPLAEMKITGRNTLVLKPQDDILVGKVRVKDIQDQQFLTDTNLPFAPLYKGTTILNKEFKSIGTVNHVPEKGLTLAAKPIIQPVPGEDVWLSNLGVGDKVVVKGSFSWQSRE
jgi:oligo-alginate lyase